MSRSTFRVFWIAIDNVNKSVECFNALNVQTVGQLKKLQTTEFTYYENIPSTQWIGTTYENKDIVDVRTLRLKGYYNDFDYLLITVRV